MQRRWKIPVENTGRTYDLYQSLKINYTLCKILAARGIDAYDKAKNYFRPQLEHLHDPWLMKDMLKAVKRILQAVEKKEKVLIYGDYDVDGTTAVASFYSFITSFYNNVEFYIPHRYKEGYGVSATGIEFAITNGFSLIISLDCGIKSVELIGYAKAANIDFVVCDHHLPDDTLPPAVAILNPRQQDCDYPFKELCGCGIGFKLMHAIADELSMPAETYLRYIDLVATAIAADIVPVTGENRILSFYGLKKVNENPCTGIKALIQLAAIQKKLTFNNLVFVIAPRINAAGRMDDARKVIQLLTETDYSKALAFAEMLHNDNTDRREADSSTTEEALCMIKEMREAGTRKTTVVYKKHWHKGVVGIVASRLIDAYYRPTVVLTQSGDIVAGSARSVPGFNLYEAIHACRNHLLGYGGHFAAAGMTMLPEKVEDFANAFEEVVSATISDAALVPEIIIDAEVTLAELTEGFYNILCQMEPFGPDNMRPVFIAKNVTETGYSKILKEQHIRFVVKQGHATFTGIGFSMAEKFPLLQLQKNIDIVFTLDLNEWNGEKNIQLKVIDFAPSACNEQAI
ncbi:MAG TPA: single-stranded-DNA-specific exonuclease RecJ [Chitinophagaceae bacterium]|nr:single-stranded-DNA-specific exonuclease RecJ [Chitinophagaceae bacterium]